VLLTCIYGKFGVPAFSTQVWSFNIDRDDLLSLLLPNQEARIVSYLISITDDMVLQAGKYIAKDDYTNV